MKFTTKSITKMILFILVISSSLFANKINFEAIAQTAALKMGGEGYIIKGSYESGLLKKGESKHITLTLYHPNNYQLAIGTREGVTDYKVSIYDESYNLIKEEQIANAKDDFVSINVTPKTTQTYYIKIDYNKGSKNKAEWVFLYGYKN